MFYLLLMVVFLSNGEIVPGAKIEASPQACAADIQDITSQPKPDDVASAGFQCLGPYSDPLTEKAS